MPSNKKKSSSLSEEEKKDIRKKNQYVAYDHKYRRKKNENIQVSVFTLIIGTIIIALLILFFMMYNLWGAFYFAIGAEGVLIIGLGIFIIYTCVHYNPLIKEEDEMLKKAEEKEKVEIEIEKEKEEAEKVVIPDPSAGPSSRSRSDSSSS
ncbi:MAG: hypothetical protein LUB56_00040 [Coprobacillus sp.]|nr:hypothetical protein [Coprobacillus sp.]